MADIKDVAREAGVAVSTVSKVLNNYPNVSETTKAKVNEAINRMNYIPNSIASALSCSICWACLIVRRRRGQKL